MKLRFQKTITKYLLLELISPFGLGLLIFTFVLFMQQVLRLIELVINKGVGVSVVLRMIAYIMPSFLVMTIPMAVLVATLSAFGRLSTDSEITAMKASGISLYSLCVPVLIFATGATAITFFFYAEALPWGNRNFRLVLYELARTKAAIALKDKVFDTSYPGLVIYIEEIDDQDVFHGVMLSDTRDNNNQQVIFADTGRLISDEKQLRVILRLENGESHPKNVVNPLKYQIVKFPALDILLSFQGNSDDSPLNIEPTDRDMTIPQLAKQYVISKQMAAGQAAPPPSETPENGAAWHAQLWQYTQITGKLLLDSFMRQDEDANDFLVEIHKRFSFPAACLVFGVIATPLGIQSRRSGKSGGFATSLFLLLIYYIFIVAGESLGDNGRLPAILAVWTPNILLGATGVILLIKVAKR